jgi:hypothetical protein
VNFGQRQAATRSRQLAEITASRISEYKAKRLAAVRKIGKGESAMERRLTAAAVNRPLALLRHLLRLAHEEWEAIETYPASGSRRSRRVGCAG